MSPPAEPSPRPDITQLLRAAGDGDDDATAALATAVYAELRALAKQRLRGDPAGRTTQPTALVHEVWLRLGIPNATFKDRAHFFAAAARVMRQTLVDRHRQQHSGKRDVRRLVAQDPDELAATVALPPVDLLALDEALVALAALDARMVEIVQLRFFAGLSVEDTALALDVSARTVKREWNVARAWLYQRLGPIDPA